MHPSFLRLSSESSCGLIGSQPSTVEGGEATERKGRESTRFLPSLGYRLTCAARLLLSWPLWNRNRTLTLALMTRSRPSTGCATCQCTSGSSATAVARLASRRSRNTGCALSAPGHVPQDNTPPTVAPPCTALRFVSPKKVMTPTPPNRMSRLPEPSHYRPRRFGVSLDSIYCY